MSPQFPPRYLCYRRGYGAPILDIAVVYEGEEQFPSDFIRHHRALFDEATHARHTFMGDDRSVLFGIKRQGARFIPAAAVATTLESPQKTSTALGAGDMLERLAGRLGATTTRDGAQARNATSLGGMEVFASEECVVDVALVGTVQKARRVEDLRHPGWVCHYRQNLSFVDISDGVVRDEPLYMVYQRGGDRPPITAIRVISSATATPRTRHGGDAAHAHGENDAEGGWHNTDVSLPDFLLLEDDQLSTGAKIGMVMQVRRDVGAPPIVALDFINAESEAVPNGWLLVDHKFGRHERSHLFGKKRDLRLVYKVGDVPSGSIALLKQKGADMHPHLPREVLDRGLTVIPALSESDQGDKATHSKLLTVRTNVPIPRWSRPQIIITSDEAHPVEMNVVTTMISERSFTMQATHKDGGVWNKAIKVAWEITGRSRLNRTHRRVDVDTDVLHSRRTFEVVEQLRAATFRVPEIAFEVDGWLPVSHIAVQHEGVKYLILSPRTASGTVPKVRVAVGVRIVNDVRIITLSSPLIVHNNLDITMELCYQRTMHDETVTVALDKGGTFCLPLGMADQPEEGEFAPLLRFYSQEQKCCFYSTDPLDIQDLGTTDWVQQCALGYVYKRPFPNTSPLWVRQPMDFIDSAPGLTTNRFAYSDKDVGFKSASELAIAGYRIAGYVTLLSM